jgi:hypothetical protein
MPRTLLPEDGGTTLPEDGGTTRLRRSAMAGKPEVPEAAPDRGLAADRPAETDLTPLFLVLNYHFGKDTRHFNTVGDPQRAPTFD